MAYTIEEYKRLVINDDKLLKRNLRIGGIRLARIYQKKLQLYAPTKSRRIKNSIKRTKNQVVVRGKSNKGFPYIHWINQTKGANMTRLKVKPRIVTRKGKKVKLSPRVFIENRWVKVPEGVMVYGSKPNWKWTGKARFQQIALSETKKKVRSLIKKIRLRTSRGVRI